MIIDSDDILNAREAAAVGETDEGYMRVLLRRGLFPPPFRKEPNLWLRETVEAWKADREAVKR